MENFNKCPRCGNTTAGDYVSECGKCYTKFCKKCKEIYVGNSDFLEACPACNNHGYIRMAGRIRDDGYCH